MRLEMEGFTAFRQPTVVDFAGVDLFAVTGATGAGKTTIIDALSFALYGCVPRYDDKRLVAPAISQGRNEARVRLDFAVGEARYSAVRVVRRTKGGGATTREAILERTTDGVGYEVLAKNERELGEAVESLLGLSYDHFIKCVVLPQGDFARFLHDKPERRQELLVELLDLGVYERMGRLAREREKVATRAAESVARRLDDLAAATPEAHAAAIGRAVELGRLLDEIDVTTLPLAELGSQVEEATRQATAARDRSLALERVEVPAGTADLGRRLADAIADAEGANREEAGAEGCTSAAEAAARALPARSELELAQRAHVEVLDLRRQRDRGQQAMAACHGDEAVTATSSAEAQAHLARARAALERAQAEHRAHAVMGDLVAGAPCPVCRQPVIELPDVAAPAALDQARVELQRVEAVAADAAARLAAAARERERVTLKVESVAERLSQLEAVVSSHPDAVTVERTLAEVVAADAALARARAQEAGARGRHRQARQSLDEVRRAEADARAGYDRTRDSLAGLLPPEGRVGRDLAADWAALTSWAHAEAVGQRRVLDDETSRATELARRRRQLVAGLEARASRLGIEVDAGRPLRDPVVEAHVRAENDERSLAAALAEADRLRDQRAQIEGTAAVARDLGRHLSARGFEKWLLDEALGLLVDGATLVLGDLSGGQYSLTLDERSSNFAVIDHRNADERRPARTLSGGETFLASLALALALADQLALLAARGAARLESIFLDEGFGTLDPETLDTVAAAMEELGTRDRMVGLISHVPELAQRVPVRFEVIKQSNSSSIRRIDQ